jgi:hypothetical protein
MVINNIERLAPIIGAGYSDGFPLEVELRTGGVLVFNELKIQGGMIGNKEEGWVSTEEVESIVTDSGVGPYYIFNR